MTLEFVLSYSLKVCLQVTIPTPSKVYHCVNGDGQDGFRTHSASVTIGMMLSLTVTGTASERVNSLILGVNVP